MAGFLNTLASFAPGYDTLDGAQFSYGTPGFNPDAPDPTRAGLPNAVQFPQRHGFLNTLGRIGDVLAVIGNRAPIYSTMQGQQAEQTREHQVQDALSHIDPNDPNSVNALLPLNPELWAKVRQALVPPNTDQPSSFREYQLGEKDPSGYGAYLQSRLPVPVIGDLEHGLMVSPVYQPYSFAGGQPHAAPQAHEMPTVNSPQEAMRLPPGTQFRMPDGRVGTVPGGASGNAGGRFPNIERYYGGQ